MTAPRPYLTRAQAAQRLNIGPAAVKHLHHRLPHTRTLGGHHRFDVAGVEAEAERRAAAKTRNANPTSKETTP